MLRFMGSRSRLRGPALDPPPPKGPDPGVAGKLERASGFGERTGNSARAAARARSAFTPGARNPTQAARAPPNFIRTLGPPTSRGSQSPRRWAAGAVSRAPARRLPRSSELKN